MGYFKRIVSAEQAYWLGFITADGSVSWNSETGNYGLTIYLAQRDQEHLEKLHLILGGTPLRRVQNSVGKTWFSKEMAAELIDLGVVPAKSKLSINTPLFPPNLASHFWRGYFDGDGCLSIQQKKGIPEYRFSLAGSEPMLQDYQKWSLLYAGSRPQKIDNARNQFGISKVKVFFMNGNRQIETMLAALYRNANTYLARKFALYEALVKQNAQKGYNTVARRYVSPPLSRHRSS